MLTVMPTPTVSAPLASATMSRYWPPRTSVRMAPHTRCTRRWALHAEVRPPRRCRRPTPGPDRRAGSPPTCRTAPMARASCCCGAVRRRCRCTVGSPRRVAEASMTSSCTSAQACSSSSAENRRSTCSASGLGVLGHRTPAPVGERRAQPLAAAKHELLEGLGQLGVVAPDVGGARGGGRQGNPAVVR